MILSEKIGIVEPSKTLAITSLAKSLKAEGKDVVSFGAGEPDFDTPDAIKDAGRKAIDAGFTKYTPASGTMELKKAIAAKFKKDNGLTYDTSQVIVSCGAKHSIFNVFQVLCNPGDEVIVIAPYWLSYPEMIKLAGGKPVVVQPKEDAGFKADVTSIEGAVTERTRAIIINSPSNPAGVVYTSEELKEIADIAVRKDILVISDEIYEKFIYDGYRHTSIASFGKEIYDRTITVNGMSKTFAMTGWRIGYIGAPAEIAKAISVLQSHSTSNPTSISQKAALAALSLSQAEIEKMRKLFEERRDFMMSQLDAVDAIGYTKPHGAFYLYCNIEKTGMPAKDFAKKVLEEKLVAVIPGEAFGSAKHIRLSYAVGKDTIQKGIERLRVWDKQ